MTETAEAAGCIVIRRGKVEPEVLLIWTKHYPDPTLPKGRVETGESPLECALREVCEETGYIVDILCKTPITMQTVLDKHAPVVHKTTHYFPARVRTGSPQERMEKTLIRRVDWLPVSRALEQMQRSDEIQAVRKYLDLLKTEGEHHP